MNSEQPSYPPANDARASMEQLAVAAIGALQKAEMADEIHSRLFARPPADLIEWVDSGEGRSECRYRPMVELLLLELAAIGADSSIDVDEQQRRIHWTLEAAGL